MHWHKKQVSFIIWQKIVVIKTFLSRSIHFTVACFKQFRILWLLLEAEITGPRFVLEQPFILCKGCFYILSRALWQQNLFPGVLPVFNNGIYIGEQYLYQCLDNLCRVTYFGKLLWEYTQPGLYWQVWEEDKIFLHAKSWYGTYFLMSDGRLKSHVSCWFGFSKLQSQIYTVQLLSIHFTLTGNLILLFQVVNVFHKKFLEIHA